MDYASGDRKIAVFGIGNMGWPMAANLVKGSFEVTVFDAVHGRAAQFAAEVGGAGAETATLAAQGADVVITILPTSAHVESVLTEIRPALRRGGVVIEMSSGVPMVTQRLAAALAEDGIAMIDAPVSGGVGRAKSGTLSIMAGGDEADLDRVAPVLAAISSTVHRVGPVGAGQAMKALNNLVSAGGFLIGIEALLIGQKFGLEAGQMVDVLNASTGMNNASLQKFRQFVLSRRFDSGFGLDLMLKDLTIALDVGRDGRVATPFAALCREMAASASALLGPGQDHTAFARFSETLAGMELAAKE